MLKLKLTFLCSCPASNHAEPGPRHSGQTSGDAASDAAAGRWCCNGLPVGLDSNWNKNSAGHQGQTVAGPVAADEDEDPDNTAEVTYPTGEGTTDQVIDVCMLHPLTNVFPHVSVNLENG